MNRDSKGRFVKGNTASKGKPKGSRNALSRAFVESLYADWLENGDDILRAMREQAPSQYARVVAMLVPKDIDVHHSGETTVRNVSVNFVDTPAIQVEEEEKVH
jgi:hypothetical protein